MTSLELMVANLDLQGRADRIARLEPEALRRDVMRAARDVNGDDLWHFVEAHLVTRGGRGARLSAHTLHSYRTGLGQFLAWAGPAGVSLLRPGANVGFRYARHLESAGHSPSTVRVRLAAARALYATLRWAAATDAAPFSDVRTASDPVPRWEKRKPYPPEDVATLLLHAGMQEALIVLLGAHCGLRNAEMTTLLRKDVHLDAPHPYLIVTGKRQRRQQVPLSLTAGRAIRTWLAATPSLADFVLTYRTTRGIEKALKKLCDNAGIAYEGREVHGLRHSAGTRTYVESGDILAVRDHLRHRTVESSEIYVNYARAGKKAVNQDW